MPSLIRVKFPCVFTNIEQKFNIYRLDQLEMELPMKTHACKILSVGVLQMHKGHLKFFLQSLYVFNVQCFQLQCVNEIPFFLPVTFIIPDVIVLFNLPRLYFFPLGFAFPTIDDSDYSRQTENYSQYTSSLLLVSQIFRHYPSNYAASFSFDFKMQVTNH